MATQAQINAHDRNLRRIADDFAQGLEPLFEQFYDRLATAPNPDRLWVQQNFQPIRQYAQNSTGVLSDVLDSNLAMNSDITGTVLQPQTQSTLPQLEQEVIASVEAQIDQEQNNILNSLGMAALVGGLTATALGELRNTISSAVRRIKIRYGMSTRNFDGAVTLLQGQNQPNVVYRYTGGIVKESRDFCTRMDGRTLTEAEIRNIWSTQSWQGKQPGDPFVVRGGYNCRHIFVAEERTNA
jgi:hypothetical protein